MTRTASTFGQGFAFGIAALTLATGPLHALGFRPVTLPVGTAGLVGSQAQPATAPVNQAPLPAGSVVPTLVQVPAQYSPQVLDLGTLKGYQNQTRSATVTIIAPADGNVSAFVQPQSNGPIQVTSMSRSLPVNLNNRLYGRTLETTDGNGELHAQAGDEIVVEVTARANAHLPNMLGANLEVVSQRWHVEVPVRAWVVQEPEIAVDPQTGEFRIASEGEATATLRLRRTRYLGTADPNVRDRDVTITAPRLPAGIVMDPLTVRVPANVPWVDATVHFHAAYQPAVGFDQPALLHIDTGVDRFDQPLAAQVYPDSMTWHYDLQAGDVKLHGSITIWANGSWYWDGLLHDDGTVLGDDFAAAIRPNLPLDDVTPENGAGFPAAEKRGSLGAVLGGQRDGSVSAGGKCKWLMQHYCDVYDTGFTAELNASADLTPSMEDFFGKLLQHVPAYGIDL
jgi:hypothetical protein